MRKHLGKMIFALVILTVLTGAYWYGGSAPGLQGWRAEEPPSSVVSTGPSGGTAASTDTSQPDTTLPSTVPDGEEEPDVPAPATPDTTPQENPPDDKDNADPGGKTDASVPPSSGSDSGKPLTAQEKLELAASLGGGKSSEGVTKGDADYSASQGMELDSSTGKDKYLTSPVPEGKPVPVEPEDAVISDRAMTCTLSVRCDAILDNMSWLDPEKTELVPEDGVIFEARQVTFYEGESVFNVLHREMKLAGIHLAFRKTPMYNSVYIEGIQNLYEFDVGELSGWMYKVNDWFPNYGCSRYQLNEGDVVEWVYTCNLGIDVGGYYAAAGE